LNWETSGNGFGQREEGSDEFGHFSGDHLTLITGDNRSGFIQEAKGHGVHHLFLWHLADSMGILSNVLNVMSPEVSASSENIPAETAAVQRPRKRRLSAADEAAEKTNKRREDARRESFQVGVVASLSCISISQVQEQISRKEACIREFRLALLEPRMSNDKRELYNELIEHHQNKVAKFELDVKEMRVGANEVIKNFRASSEKE